MIALTESVHVRALLSGPARIGPYFTVRAIEELSTAAERADVAAIVCDPCGVPDHRVLALVERVAGLSKRLYFASELTSRVSDVTLRAAKRGLTGALLCGCAEDVRLFLRQVRAARTDTALPLRLLTAVSDSLWRLPPLLRGELVALTTTCCRGEAGVATLARRAGASPRSVARWLADAGLEEPRKVCAVLRLAHMWPGLWIPGVSMSALAREAGYASERTMRAHASRHLGSCPRRMRRFLTEEHFVVALVAAARRSSDGRMQRVSQLSGIDESTAHATTHELAQQVSGLHREART